MQKAEDKDQALEFILAVPGGRYHEFAELLGPFQTQCAQATQQITAEVTWNGLRLVVAHDPATAQEQSLARKTTMNALEEQAATWSGKLEGQDQRQVKRDRKLSDSGTKARFYHEVCDGPLDKILRGDMPGELFSYAIDDDALKLAQMMDGKLPRVTNVPEQVTERYKSLADIERGVKVLKSELEIGPVYHRLPGSIRANAAICFMALVLHRLMRMRLRAANTGIAPERALRSLKRIHHHRVSPNGAQPLSGVSFIGAESDQVLKALKVKQPTKNRLLSLL